MANGFGSFYIGTSGLQNAQNAINTTSNNLANVNTEGYVREQVRFSDKSYITRNNPTSGTNIQQSGLGVTISDVAHVRDIFLDKSYRQETGRKGFYSQLYSSTSYVEDLLQEMDGAEFKDSISDLWQAFQEYGKDPSNSTNQNLVLQKAELFLSRSNTVYSDLQSYQSNINLQIKDQVNRINEIGDRIFALNLEIQKTEAGGIETAMTARDERDLLLDELAGYVKIEAEEDSTGYVTVKIEGQYFVEDNRCNHVGLTTEKGSGFYTPYWPHLTTEETYMPLFSDVALPKSLADQVGSTQTTNISTELNNDIGSLKALLVSRGSEYGTYDYMTEENYSNVEDCVVMETEAEISYLFRQLVLAMNDIFCPNTTFGEATGNTGSVTGTDANGNTVTITANTKILDVGNASVGADGKLPPEELFTRDGYDRYTEVTVNGETYYVYNEETDASTSSWYKMGNVSVNSKLIAQVTNMPSFNQDGSVNYGLADQLTESWSNKNLFLNPEDDSPCNFEGFYDKIIDRLGTSGSIYSSSTDTLTATVSAIDTQRSQITGVSSDEELTLMIKYQSAYNASSRFITVISEMTELIVGLI